jgi:hypothetical protein
MAPAGVEAAAGSPAPSVDEMPAAAKGSADLTADAPDGATDGSAAELVVETKTKPAAAINALHTLYIATYPQGAEVFMNGKRLGMTPVIAKMHRGVPVKLSVEKRGFQTVVKKYTSTEPKSGIRFKLVKSCTGLGCM